MGAFWDLVQDELDRERFPPSDRKLALRLGVSPSTPKNWRDGLKQLPTEKSIQAVADFTGRSYETVLSIAQSEEREARETARAARKGKSAARQQRAADAEVPPDEAGPEFGA